MTNFFTHPATIGAVLGGLGNAASVRPGEDAVRERVRAGIGGAVIGGAIGGIAHHFLNPVKSFGGNDVLDKSLAELKEMHQHAEKLNTGFVNRVIGRFGKPTMQQRKSREILHKRLGKLVELAGQDQNFSPQGLRELQAMHSKSGDAVNVRFHTVGGHWQKFHENYGQDVHDLLKRHTEAAGT